MKYSRIFMLLILSFMSVSLVAEEPTSKEEQCEQYGSYQDADGNWQTCDTNDEPSEDET